MQPRTVLSLLLVASSAALPASASVITHAINIAVPANSNGLYVNVETGATYTGTSPDSAFAGWDLNPYGATTMSFSMSSSANGASSTVKLVSPSGSLGTYISNLPAGFSIGPQLVGGSSGASFGPGSTTFTTSNPGYWVLNADNYFGFRFTAADGLVHYGWGRMAMGASPTVRTLVEVAWETSAGVAIAVGDHGAPPRCAGDLDGDRNVNGADLGLLLGGWGSPGPADLDNDGTVNGADLGLLLGAWGACP